MPEVLRRQMEMLRLIPRHPRKITTAELRARLCELGFATTPRTIQRDLHTLASAFALEHHGATKPFAWRWQRDAPLFELPPIDAEMAAALLDAASAMPLPSRARLDSLLTRAREVLR